MKRLFHALNVDMRSMMDFLPKAFDEALPLRTTHRRDLPDAIRELSETLTSERGNLGESYWASPRTVSAYVRYFLPWNIFRLARLLPSLELPSPEDLTNGTILDLGSGPLTLPIALWISRPELRTVPLTIVCSDVSPHILEIGHTIFTKLVGEDCPWTINTMRAPFEAALRAHYGKANFIMAGNVLNELRTKTDQALEDRLWEVADILRNALTDKGRILLVEPGTRLGGKLITLVRRAALENGLMPFAPCTHHEDCAMLSRKVTGWCHFTFSVHDAPDWLMKMSRDAGFERDSASLSFVLLGEATEAPEANATRVISDAFPIPRRREPVRYACSSDGLTLLYDARPLISGALVTAAWPESPIRDDKSGGMFAGWINDEGETQGLVTPFSPVRGERSMNRPFRPHGRPEDGDERRPSPRGQHFQRQDRDGERSRFGQDDDNRQERRIFTPRGDKNFGDKPYAARDAERRPYNKDGERRPYNKDGERRPYSKDGERRPYNKDGEGRSHYGRPYQDRSDRAGQSVDAGHRDRPVRQDYVSEGRAARGTYEGRHESRSENRPQGSFGQRRDYQDRSGKPPFQKPPFGSARTYGQREQKQEKPDDWGNKNYNWEQQAQRYQHADHMPYEKPIANARSHSDRSAFENKRPFQRRDDERRPFNRDGQARGEGRSFQDRGERRSYDNDRPRSDRPRFDGASRDGRGERQGRDERRSFDNERGDRRPYGNDRGGFGGDRRPRSDRPYGDRSRFDGPRRDSREGRDERSFNDRGDRGERRSYDNDRPRSDRPYGDRSRFDGPRREGRDDRSFNDRGDRRSYDNDRPRSDRPYGDRPRFDGAHREGREGREGRDVREGRGERSFQNRGDRPQRGYNPYRGKQDNREGRREGGDFKSEGRGEYSRPRHFIPKPWTDNPPRDQHQEGKPTPPNFPAPEVKKSDDSE